MERKVFNIFLASPSDLAEERKIIRDETDRINNIIGKSINWHIELLGWEDTLPGANRPQDLINKDIEKCDLFLGLLWKRWGQSTGKTNSGFKEEFDLAIKLNERNKKPEIWIYLKNIKQEFLIDPGEQLTEVLKFRGSLIENKKILYKEFIDTNSCEKLFNDNILRYLLTMNVENSLNKNIDEINKNRGEVITREELKEFEKYLMDKLKSQRKLKPDRSYQDLSSNVRKYVMQNKFEEAMGFIKNNLSENFYWMGYCYGEQSKIEEMLNSFKKCISISDKYKSEIEKSKKFYWAQTFNKGSKFFTNANKEKNSKLEMNLRDSATKAFRDCLLIYPDDVETNKNLAFVYMSAGKNEEAIEPLKKMIQLNKELDAYKYLGDIYYSLGSMNKSSYSSNDNAEGNIVAQKYFLEAVNILEEGLKFYPEDSELLKTLSASYVETGKSDVALSSFAALVNKEPDNKVYRYNHGVLLLGNDEFAMAEKEFLKAIELDPNYNNAIYNLAVTYVKWGIEINRQSEKLGKLNNEYKEKYTAALPYLEKVTGRDKKNAEVWELLGKLYSVLGMQEKAINAFSQADQLR